MSMTLSFSIDRRNTTWEKRWKIALPYPYKSNKECQQYLLVYITQGLIHVIPKGQIELKFVHFTQRLIMRKYDSLIWPWYDIFMRQTCQGSQLSCILRFWGWIRVAQFLIVSDYGNLMILDQHLQIVGQSTPKWRWDIKDHQWMQLFFVQIYFFLWRFWATLKAFLPF